jgi:hypothetical protein
VGYSREKKGYRCFDQVKKRMYESMDVTFCESEPYFCSAGVYVSSPTVLTDFHDIIPSPCVNTTSEISREGETVETKGKDQVEECELVDPRGEQEAQLVVLNPVDSGTNSGIISPFEKHYVRTRRNEAKQPHRVEDQYQLPLPINSSLLPTDSGDIPISDLHLPIAQGKEIRLCTLKGSTAPSTSHSISDFVFLDKLSPTFKAFTTSLHYVIVPCDWKIAMQDPMWKAAMFEEMRALIKNGT